MGNSTLYVVAGPIGNLLDITLRALEVLKRADLVVSEDTRETFKLLNHFGINARQLSYRDQNHDRVLPQIFQVLESGNDVALVSDSGTPLISDPGYKLVRDVKARGFTVSPVPGPSAIISALSASGLPTDKFIFLGFLPKGLNQRKELLKNYGELEATLCIYESPYRIKKLLEETQEVLGNRLTCLAGEITKLHEKIDCDRVNELLNRFDKLQIKGEYVVLIAKKDL